MALDTTTNGVAVDGSMAYGEQIITVNSVSYIMKGGDFKRGSERKENKNNKGVPKNQRFTATVPTGSNVLQLDTQTTPTPPQFSTFALAIRSGGAIACIISEVGEKTSQDDDVTVPITFYALLNP